MTPASDTMSGYTERMRSLGRLLLLPILAFALPAAAQEPGHSPLDEPASPTVGGAVSEAMRPAYRLVEGVSDGVFDFMRVHLIDAVIPTGLSRQVAKSPQPDSYALFERNMSREESRYLVRLREAYPTLDGTSSGSAARLEAWQGWARQEQVSVLVDAFKDTLLERHDLARLGKSSGDYARDSSHWDPEFLAMAGLIGGTFLYLNGLHAEAKVGDLRVAMDVRSGLKLQNAVRSQSDVAKLGGVELGYKDNPLKLAADWGLEHGQLREQQIGLKYRLRY